MKTITEVKYECRRPHNGGGIKGIVCERSNGLITVFSVDLPLNVLLELRKMYEYLKEPRQENGWDLGTETRKEIGRYIVTAKRCPRGKIFYLEVSIRNHIGLRLHGSFFDNDWCEAEEVWKALDCIIESRKDS